MSRVKQNSKYGRIFACLIHTCIQESYKLKVSNSTILDPLSYSFLCGGSNSKGFSSGENPLNDLSAGAGLLGTYVHVAQRLSITPYLCPHYAGKILKHSFISMVRPTVHTNPSRKRSFSKTLWKPEEFENACFAF